MKRDELKEILKDLNPTDEHIDRIMAVNGTDINNAKSTLNADITSLRNRLADRDKDIAALKAVPNNSEELSKKLDALQSKYDTDTKALQSQIDKRNYSDAMKAAIADNGIKFSSKAAEGYFMSELEKKQLKIDNGKLLGFEEFHKAQLEADKGAFIVDTPNADGARQPAMQFLGATGTGDKPAASAAAIAAARFNKQFGRVQNTQPSNTNN